MSPAIDVSPTQLLRLPAMDPADLESSRQCSDVRLWSADKVAQWISEIGHGDYAELFRSARVDGLYLLQLGEEDLLNIGVPFSVHRKHILLSVRELLRPTVTALELSRQKERLARAELEAMKLLVARCQRRDAEVREFVAAREKQRGHAGQFRRVHIIQRRYIYESVSPPFAKDAMMWTCCGCNDPKSDQCRPAAERAPGFSPSALTGTEYDVHHSPTITQEYQVCQVYPAKCCWASRAGEDSSGVPFIPGCNISGQKCGLCSEISYP
mmetsp:Transcript_32851/g.93220  ORF Transcript_32851/g.93220 Transcript_32851/m.93220 type:complete len:268 (+) Transcript_32851:173-976(+)